MIKQIFDSKQNEVTLSSTGRVFICVNEKEVQVQELKLNDEGEPDGYKDVTKYEYDTLWVNPIKQSADAILQAFKEARVEEIDEYDTSAAVNSFQLNGMPMWLGRDMRLTLRNRLLSEQALGKSESTVWYEGIGIPMQIEAALQLLNALEVYASDCYDITAQHKVAVLSASTIAEVGAYDITEGYPENPKYSL